MKSNSLNLKGKMKVVTRAPNWWLTLTGRIDAKRGESVALAHISGYLDKCSKIEGKEYDAADTLLASTRRDASVALGSLFGVKDEEHQHSAGMGESDVYQIRAEQRRLKREKNAAGEREFHRNKLYQIRPVIIHINTSLSERVHKLRRHTASKIDAYVKGLRKGGLADFEPDLVFSDDAADKYHAENDAIDKAIEKAADYKENHDV